MNWWSVKYIIFLIKHKRKGPLWEGRFKNVLIKTEEQLLHLTRYVHLNPVSSYLVDKPENWPASSYCEYLSEVNLEDRSCNYENVLSLEPAAYKNFVEDRISYQRELVKIRKLILDEPNSTPGVETVRAVNNY